MKQTYVTCIKQDKTSLLMTLFFISKSAMFKKLRSISKEDINLLLC